MRRSSKSLMSESNLMGKVALPSIIAVKFGAQLLMDR